MLPRLLRLFRYLLEPQRLLLLVALYCAGLLLFAVGLVRIVNLVPCPLCIVQRFFFAFAGLSAFIGFMGWWPRFTGRTAGVTVALFSCIGWLVALRHVYIQHFPNTDPSSGCAVSFGSFLDDLIFALGGTGNCALVDWTLLGFSIPELSLMAFTLIFAAGIRVALWKRAVGLQSETDSVK